MAKKKTLKGIGGLKYPNPDKIINRNTTIARSMASSLMPRVGATEEERIKMIELLYGKEESISCVYCGKKPTPQERLHLDHLHPLIKNGEPTGYYTELANLVPCCTGCNSNKGNDEWDVFMNKEGEKFKYLQKGSTEWKNRYNRLQQLIDKMPAKQLILDPELKKEWKNAFNAIVMALSDAQNTIDKLKEQIK